MAYAYGVSQNSIFSSCSTEAAALQADHIIVERKISCSLDEVVVRSGDKVYRASRTTFVRVMNHRYDDDFEAMRRMTKQMKLSSSPTTVMTTPPPAMQVPMLIQIPISSLDSESLLVSSSSSSLTTANARDAKRKRHRRSNFVLVG